MAMGRRTGCEVHEHPNSKLLTSNILFNVRSTQRIEAW